MDLRAKLPDSEWGDWIHDWLESLSHGDLDDDTLIVYHRGACQFLDYVAEQHPAVQRPNQVTARVVEGWLGSLKRKGRAPATRRVRLMTLKAFYRWLRREPGADLNGDPTQDVPAPTVTLKPIPVIHADDVRAILRTCEGSPRFIDLRDAAIIRTLVACGLRRAELCGLNVSDVDLRAGDLAILGKGRKPRLVSISGGKTQLALSRYLRLRRRHTAARQDPLFLSTRPTADGDWRLQGCGVDLMIKRRAKKAGVASIHPHQFRHTWADAVKRAGVSNEDLERMAGWSTPEMSRRYGAELADERARDSHRRAALGDQY